MQSPAGYEDHVGFVHPRETDTGGPSGLPQAEIAPFVEKLQLFHRFVAFRFGCSFDCTGADGQAPAAFYPTVEEFIGEGGSFTHPRAVLENYPGVPAGACRAGREAMGAFRFAPLTLAPGASARYILLLGVEESDEAIDRLFVRYDTAAKVDAALASALRGGFPVQHKR